MCFASLKDAPQALPEVMQLANDQTKADVKVVPAFTVLGEATNWPNDAAREYMSNKLAWFILYDNKEAVMARAESFAKWIPNFKGHCKNDDPEQDMDVAYSGHTSCLMSPGLTSSQDNFYMFGSFKCKDEEAVEAAMDIIKKHGDETMQHEKDGFIGALLIPPAARNSDMDQVLECEKDDLDTLHVTYLLAFKTEDDWHNHEKKEYWGPFLMGLADRCLEKDEEGQPNMADITIQLHFSKAATLAAASDLPAPKEAEKKSKTATPEVQEVDEVQKELAKALKKVDKHLLGYLKAKDPPQAVRDIAKMIFYIMQDGQNIKGKEWEVLLKFVSSSAFKNNFTNILNKPAMKFHKIAEKIQPLMEGIDKDQVTKASKAAGALLDVVLKLGEWCVMRAEAK